MPFDPAIHHRRSIRLKGYDYTLAGAYFVTLVTHGRERLFGAVMDGEMRLSLYGRMAAGYWLRLAQLFPQVELGEWVVMPDHFHGIIWIVEDSFQGGVQALGQGGGEAQAFGQGQGEAQAFGQGQGEASALGDRWVPQSQLADASPPLIDQLADASPPRRPNGTVPGSLNAIVQNYKSVVARKINQQRGTPGAPVWQRDYYEHIVRSEDELGRISAYIAANPQRWTEKNR